MQEEPSPQGVPLNGFRKVTPFSKYLAMVLFVALPFIGGWVGYTYAPEKIIEVERVVVQDGGISQASEDTAHRKVVSTSPGYVFISESRTDADFGGQTDFKVSVYKDQALLQTFAIAGVNTEPDRYTLSPDEKFVAFKAGTTDGGCVARDTIMVIDLKGLELESSLEPDQPLESRERSALRQIKEISWSSDTQLEVTYEYGLLAEDGEVTCGPHLIEMEQYTILHI